MDYKITGIKMPVPPSERMGIVGGLMLGCSITGIKMPVPPSMDGPRYCGP